MDNKYKVQRNNKHIAVKYPKTLNAFGTFIMSSALTAVTYGIITTPFMTQGTEELLARDSSDTILLFFGAFAAKTGMDAIKTFKLERKQKKLQAKLARQEISRTAEQDIYDLYKRVEAKKRFENINEQTKSI